jgi:hypothetical protein
VNDSPPPQPPPTTVGELIAESGRTASPQVADFLEFAMGAQRALQSKGARITGRITRSAALWALMKMDDEIASALDDGGISLDRFSEILSITKVTRYRGKDTAEVHDDFASALRTYLHALPRERQVVDLVDVAIAIMQSVRVGSGGLLWHRLSQMTVSYDDIMSSLASLMSGSAAEPSETSLLPELSQSMLTVAASMPRPPHEMTAIAIASAIAELHPEYAGGQLGTVGFRQLSSTEASRTWPEWYAAVARWFDGDALARAGREVLDGRLFLFGLGLTDNALHETLQRAGAWGPLAVEIDIAVAPVGSRLWSVLNGVQFANGYQSDRASGQDQLGIQGEVNAVCEVIIDPEVTPPLSIGLFGEWGAGKSFFMEKMRERITERSQMPDMAEFSVVQVRFNAWHYADTSLWASLAIEIFERLVDPEPVDADDRHEWLCGHGDAHRAQREELLKQLETYRDAKSQLDAERSHLQAERDQVDQRRQDAAQKHRETIEKVRLTDVAAELVKNPDVHAALKEVSDELGFTPAVEDLAELGKELRTTAGYLPGIWRLVRHKSWAVALTAAFVALVLTAPALVARGGLAWLLPLAGSIGTITTATALIRPAVRKVNAALGHVEKAIRIASQVRETLQTRRGLDERSLELELAEIEREIAETTQTIASLDDKIASTDAAAKALTVGRKLHDFLAERAAGYQKHQGVVGMLHRDFRFLDAQLRSYQGSAERQLPRIDRVVLYIDDLDRCPPAKVLEVLEAVHLLLALELFVVVVGVDPRWLQRSLRHQYRDLSAGNDPFADPYLHSMPIEYLEKIFQIPLTLSAMEPSGYARLIGSLAPSVTTETPAPVRPSATAHQEVAEDVSGGERTPSRAPLEVQEGSAAFGDVGERIDLTRPEVEFAQQLGVLVASPRAAKRLMNTYRLIRATRHVGSRSRFLGRDGRPGEFQAVLTLLAVAAGHPMMTDRLLVALQDASTAGVHFWAEFVRELSPGSAERDPGRLLPADLADKGPGLARWSRMQNGLMACTRVTALNDLDAYQQWGPVVARFSFTL